MSIRVNKSACIGCGRCAQICPGTLISLKENAASMDYPRDCWGCVSCVKECPVGAIGFFLGADIGGNGSVMHVTPDGDILHWRITALDGVTTVIDVNRRSANRY